MLGGVRFGGGGRGCACGGGEGIAAGGQRYSDCDCCCCCCCQANIHSDGRYGFIEFRSAEYASAALELNGQINLMNQSLQIGRPASYVDPNKVSWCWDT